MVHIGRAACFRNGVDTMVSRIARAFEQPLQCPQAPFGPDPLATNFLKAQNFGIEVDQLRSQDRHPGAEIAGVLTGIVQAVKVVAGDDHCENCVVNLLSYGAMAADEIDRG